MSDLLGDRLEALLAELYSPERTKAGNVATKKGRPKYRSEDLTDFGGRYLGLSIDQDSLLLVRNDDPKANIFVKMHVERALRRYERGRVVPYYVALDEFRRYARSSIDFFYDHGVARDGRSSIVESLEWWAAELHECVDVALLDEAYRLEEAMGMEPPLRDPPTPQTGAGLTEAGEDIDLMRRVIALGEPREVRSMLNGRGGFIWGDQNDTNTARLGRATLRDKLEALECSES